MSNDPDESGTSGKQTGNTAEPPQENKPAERTSRPLPARTINLFGYERGHWPPL